MKLFSLIVVGAWLAGVVGWIMNIMQIVHTADLPMTGLFIVKCIGIFVAPLGAVLGYLG